MTFDNLGLSTELLQAVSQQGYSKPTPIQSSAIPAVLKGKDVLAAAQTGTGKTAGFTLPLLHRLNKALPTDQKRVVRALILTPTRELAAQVGDSVRCYGARLPLRSTIIYGGVSIRPQTAALRKGVDILIATPGRLLDHVSQGNLDLSKVETLVLDEADRMLDMGFIHDIRKILARLPKQRQNLLFSATFSKDIKKLAGGFMNNPELVEVARQNTAAESVKQVIHHVDKKRKRELLSFLIGSQNWKQVLVFTRTKHGANRLAGQLQKDGLNSAAIHGNKSQGARTKALTDFKNGKVRVLVATDIAARGLDIDQLPHVVNFELPNVAEDYIHRIGRTGRAGHEGLAASLVSPDEVSLLKGIEKLLQSKIEEQHVEGYRPSPVTATETGQKQPSNTKGKQGKSNQGKRSNSGTGRLNLGSKPNCNRNKRRKHRGTKAATTS